MTTGLKGGDQDDALDHASWGSPPSLTQIKCSRYLWSQRSGSYERLRRSRLRMTLWDPIFIGLFAICGLLAFGCWWLAHSTKRARHRVVIELGLKKMASGFGEGSGVRCGRADYEGFVDGVSIQLGTLRFIHGSTLSSPVDSAPGLLVLAKLPQPLGFELEVRPSYVLHDATLTTGDPHFDRHCAVRTADATAAAHLLADPSLRADIRLFIQYSPHAVITREWILTDIYGDAGRAEAIIRTVRATAGLARKLSESQPI